MLQHGGTGESALNEDARAKIHLFLSRQGAASVRTPIINFRKDGKPFVNLLFMSKLTSSSDVQYIFASQFDISRRDRTFWISTTPSWATRLPEFSRCWKAIT